MDCSGWLALKGLSIAVVFTKVVRVRFEKGSHYLLESYFLVREASGRKGEVARLLGCHEAVGTSP